MTAALPIKGLHHVALTTRQAERSAEFYCDVLGFQQLRRPPFNFRGAWLYGYGMQIHIIENPDKAPDPAAEIDSRANHLAFAVEKIEPVKELLEARAVEYRGRVNAGGTQQIFFRDPDGHFIEVAVYGDPSQGYTGP